LQLAIFESKLSLQPQSDFAVGKILLDHHLQRLIRYKLATGKTHFEI